MNKRIVMLAVGAMLAVALVGGGVYAYFNDTENSTGNSFTAGTLNLTLNDGAAQSISFAAVKPGDSGVDNFKLNNVGSVDGHLYASVQNIVNGAGTTPEPEPTPDNGELAASMHVVVWSDLDGDKVQDAGEAVAYDGLLSGATVSIDMGALAAGGMTYLGFAWDIPTSVGNEIQGDTVTFDIVFTLNQA